MAQGARRGLGLRILSIDWRWSSNIRDLQRKGDGQTRWRLETVYDFQTNDSQKKDRKMACRDQNGPSRQSSKRTRSTRRRRCIFGFEVCLHSPKWNGVRSYEQSGGHSRLWDYTVRRAIDGDAVQRTGLFCTNKPFGSHLTSKEETTEEAEEEKENTKPQKIKM